MTVDVIRTEKGMIRADVVISGLHLYAQSDSIHGAIRNLAFEIQHSPVEENAQIAAWQKEAA